MSLRLGDQILLRSGSIAEFEVAYSFRATNNEKAFAATRLEGLVQPLLQVIRDSRTFSSTFNPAFEYPFRLPFDKKDAEDPPRPVIIRSSAADGELATSAPMGLVSAVVEAYNRHHELVLRPDDVWQAILTQFSFYVNLNAENLRERFVDFRGKMMLVVEMGGTLLTADYAALAKRMVHENIMCNIKDPFVAEWLLPGFSTTTPTDEVAAAVSIMSTLQAYFSYGCCMDCGIPRVTLLGNLRDWQRLRGKIDRLLDYDLAEGLMAKWHALLVPVLDELVRAAAGEPQVEFWDRVCSQEEYGSGSFYLTGWLTVFAVFTHRGDWQGGLDGDMLVPGPLRWPAVELGKVPAGAVSVPVLIDDNGTQYDAHMIAGQFAFEGCGRQGVALRPRTDWCIAYAGEPRAERVAYRHGELLPRVSEQAGYPATFVRRR